ncbi:flagellar protein FlgN [Cytobacillus sp. FSL K6-0265]|uniref:flagellar protein FlgN n=1 Tax=Cytobacillus sp. FSL K6-0265 TaxID=2921448 RepID=UPI0030F5AF7D
MSAEALLTVMERLISYHQSLYELAGKKTDMIKKGDMAALDQMLKDEQTHVATIKKLEQARIQIAATLVPSIEKPTIADCIQGLEQHDQQALLEKREQLASVIAKLKEKNQLNQQLIYHSLQYVNLSMNLVNPKAAAQNMNYIHPQKAKSQAATGMFQSKV